MAKAKTGARRPVIVGVGQAIRREKLEASPRSTIMLARDAVLAAAQDAEAPDVLDRADHVALVYSMTGPDLSPCAKLCEQLNISPAVRELSPIGGNCPQWLVNRAADRISAGESDVFVIAGAEAMYTRDKQVYQVPAKSTLRNSSANSEWDFPNWRSGTGRPWPGGSIRYSRTPCGPSRA